LQYNTEIDQAHALRKLSEIHQSKTAVYPVVPRTRTIAITSGKGGVGKTTISVNLAISMAKSGKRVLIFDGDLGLANINVLLGIVPKYTLYHVIKGQKTLPEIILHTKEGIDIIPGANGYSQLADLNLADRTSLLRKFSEIEDYDIIIIDTGAGIGTNVISLLLAAQELLVVTTPDPTSITDSYGLIKSVLNNDRKKNIRLLINRVRNEEEGRKVATRLVTITSKFIGVEIKALGMVYLDDEVEISTRKQKPFIINTPKCKASECINNISNYMLDIEPTDSSDASLLDFLSKFFWFLDSKNRTPKDNILEEN
jgi:flagellar biosynthesis protein FlhG